MPELEEFPDTEVQIIEFGKLKEPFSIKSFEEDLDEKSVDMLIAIMQDKLDFEAMVDESIIERMMK